MTSAAPSSDTPGRGSAVDQLLLIALGVKIIGLLIAGFVVAFLASRAYGTYRWNAGTLLLRSQLAAAQVPVTPRVVGMAELDPLPAPAQRYLRLVLQEGRPMVATARLRHSGTFNMSEAGEEWRSFTSDQKVVLRRPGFDWDGRIAMFTGVPVHVHDAYVAGEGLLEASVLGVVRVAHMRDRREAARGELMRFLAEACWYPTALLPSQGVRWAEVDNRSALATLSDGDVSATLRFTFNSDGLVETVYAESRPRTVGGALALASWEGRFWNYQERGGIRVPIDGEVAWLLPEGPKTYWRGHLEEITFTFER